MPIGLATQGDRSTGGTQDRDDPGSERERVAPCGNRRSNVGPVIEGGSARICETLRVGTTAIRIGSAAHRKLVPVVDGRGARHGQLDQGRDPEQDRILAEDRHGARRIVAPEQVVLDRSCLGSVDGEVPDQGIGECGTVQVHEIVPIVLLARGEAMVEMGSADETKDRHGERVIHQGIEAIAGQPFGRIDPDLADQIGLRVDRPDPGAELRPERRVLDVLRHVKPPSVDAEPGPVLDDLHQVLADRRMLHAQLRQPGHVPPGSIATPAGFPAQVLVHQHAPAAVEDIVVQVEPVPVGRGAARFNDVLKRPEPPTGMVEDAIEDHPDAALVGAVQELAEGRVPAEQRVDRHEIAGVVPMVRGRGEDRVQVQPRDPEIHELIQPVGEAEQVAALEPVEGGRGGPRFHGPRIKNP